MNYLPTKTRGLDKATRSHRLIQQNHLLVHELPSRMIAIEDKLSLNIGNPLVKPLEMLYTRQSLNKSPSKDRLADFQYS